MSRLIVAPVFPATTGVLAVIDLQPGFLQSGGMPAKSVIAGASLDIQRAKELDWSIVLVEFSPEKYESTHPKISRLLSQYGKAARVIKHGADGSRAVLAGCRALGHLEVRHLRLCGIEAGGCVFMTACGLRSLTNAHIEVSVDGSGSSIAGYNWYDYSAAEAQGISLIRHDGGLVVPGTANLADDSDAWASLGR